MSEPENDWDEDETPKRKRLKWWMLAVLLLGIGFGGFTAFSPQFSLEPQESLAKKHADFLNKQPSFAYVSEAANERDFKNLTKNSGPASVPVEEKPINVEDHAPDVSVQSEIMQELGKHSPPAEKTATAEVAAPSPAPEAPAANAPAMEARISALEEAISQLEARPENSSTITPEEFTNLQQSVLTMGQQVTAMKEAMDKANGTARAGAVFVNFYLLEREVLAGNPFENEFDTLMKSKETPVELHRLLEPLKKMAGDGIPTPDQLKDSFTDARKNYFAHAGDHDPSLSVLGRVEKNLSGLVTIRKVGAEQTGDDAEAVIARAEAALGEGDIAAAEQEIMGLPGADRSAFTDWLAEVDDRMQSLSTLEEARHLLLGDDAPADSHDDAAPDDDSGDNTEEETAPEAPATGGDEDSAPGETPEQRHL